MVESCFFLFLGSDEEAKEKRLAELCQKAFPPELKDLNYGVFYADDRSLTPRHFSDAILSLPAAGARRRLIVIRRAEKLSAACLASLETLLARPLSHVFVVLDASEPKAGEALSVKFSGRGFEVVRLRRVRADDVFDLGRAILASKTDAALKILKGLLSSREKAEKLIGALFWKWERSYEEKGLDEESYRKGLRVFSEADRRLRSSSSAFARETLILESLIVKLAYLAQVRRPSPAVRR